MRKVPISRIVIFAILGLMVGGVLGESLGWICLQLGQYTATPVANNYPYHIFTEAFDPSFGFDSPTGLVIDLYMIKFKLGLAIKLNLASVMGLWFAFYIERWTRAHN